MKTLQLPDGTERHVLEEDDLPTDIPRMTLVELQAAYMGMLTAMVSMFGPEAGIHTQSFGQQYLEQMLAEDTEPAEEDHAED